VDGPVQLGGEGRHGRASSALLIGAIATVTIAVAGLGPAAAHGTVPSRLNAGGRPVGGTSTSIDGGAPVLSSGRSELAAAPAPGLQRRRSGSAISLTPSTAKPRWACPQRACEAIIDPRPVRASHGYALPNGGPQLEGSGELGGYSPQDLRSAYKIPTAVGSTQTIALVDAYGYSTAEADLAKYRERYGLEPCTKGNGCFRKVNEKGEEANYPPNNEEWSLESALDLDMASAACAKCHLLLVEATTENPADTAESVNTAAKLGATEISNSYGYPEGYEPYCGKTGCAEFSNDYKHTGVFVTASAGDSGYNNHFFGLASPDFPATSPNVVAVGGTSLHKAANARGWSEQVWNEPAGKIGTGGGCSKFESKPAWQTDKGCAKRMDNDVAAVAAVETPVSVYSSLIAGGWEDFGGTSASSPLMAGIAAHASAHTRSLGADAFYEAPGSLFDVTTGSNGTCTPPSEDAYFCNAEVGYDGPTGLGTPNGVPAGPPPSVVTGVASLVARSSATLNGTVNPNGGEVGVCKLEFGTSVAYGSSAGCVPSPGSGEGVVGVSAAVSGLVGNTTYHFRVVASNVGGSGVGSDQTFKTLATAPSELQFAASIGHYENSEIKFRGPSVVAVDPSGNAWVADRGNRRVVEFNAERKYVRQFGEEGSGPGQFMGIGGVATSASGHVFVSDPGNYRVQEFGPAGEFVRSFTGHLFEPGGVAVDAEGNVWVLNSRNYPEGGRVVEFSPTGGFLGAWGSSGSGAGQLGWAYGLAVAGGHVYVAENVNQRVQEFSTTGEFVRQFDEKGSGNGKSNQPYGIAAAPGTGNLYVSEAGGSRVQEFSPTGGFVAAFGSAGSGNGQFGALSPQGVAAGPSGRVLVADTANNRVQEWAGGEAPSYLASITHYENSEIRFRSPNAVAVDPAGNIWVADSGNQRLVEFNAARKYVRQFGEEGSGPGQFQGIGGIATNAAGDVYVSDPGNYRVQEFGPAGEFLRAFTGHLAEPAGIAVDAEGNVWVLNSRNYPEGGRVVEFSATGSFLGAWGSSGSAAGQLGWAFGLAVAGGHVYVAENVNQRVQEFSTTGEFVRQFDEKGSGNGKSNQPYGIAADPTTGNIYVTENGNNRVQAFTPTGAFIATFGSPGTGNGQFGPQSPQGIAIGATTGNAIIADTTNNRIQEWAAP
jgi:DNA-binding beta-propeller fold protein YncE